MPSSHYCGKDCSNKTEFKIQRGVVPLHTVSSPNQSLPSRTVSYSIGTSLDMGNFPLRKSHEQRLGIFNHHLVTIPATTILSQSLGPPHTPIALAIVGLMMCCFVKHIAPTTTPLLSLTTIPASILPPFCRSQHPS